MDKLTAMRQFVRVVETGSFSAVARDMGTTQSAVSKQLARLEQGLGATLLSRTTRSVAPTEAGQRYFEQARRLLAEIEQAEAELHGSETELRGWLRIAASVGFGRIKLMPLVQSFMQRHPAIRIDLVLRDDFVDLVEQGMDLAVRIGDLADSSLIARRVGQSQRLLLAHRDYLRRLPAGLGAPRKPEDLLAHECLIYTGLTQRDLWSFTAGAGARDAVGTQRSVRVSGRLHTNSSEVMRAAMLGGMGIGYSPTWLFEPELASGELQRLMPDWECPRSPIQLVFPPQRKPSAKVRAFADHVASQWATTTTP